MNHTEPPAVERSVALYRTILRAYPPGFRERYADEMALAFRDAARDALSQSGFIALIALWARTLSDTVVNATYERVFGSGESVAVSRWQVVKRRVLVPLAKAVAVLAAIWGIMALNDRWLLAVPPESRGWVVIIEAFVLGLPLGLWRSRRFAKWSMGIEGLGYAGWALWFVASRPLGLDWVWATTTWLAEAVVFEGDRLLEEKTGIRNWKRDAAIAGPALLVLLISPSPYLATNVFLGFVVAVNGVLAGLSYTGMRVLE